MLNEHFKCCTRIKTKIYQQHEIMMLLLLGLLMIMGDDDDNKCFWYFSKKKIKNKSHGPRKNKELLRKAARNLSGRARGHMSIVII